MRFKLVVNAVHDRSYREYLFSYTFNLQRYVFFCLASPPKCLWSENFKDLYNFQAVLREIRIKLDPQDQIAGDYRALAGAFGMKQDHIRYLESRSNRTDELLNKYNPTLEVLRGHLKSKDVSRSDVAELIEDWVKEKCTCEVCRPRPISEVNLR